MDKTNKFIEEHLKGVPITYSGSYALKAQGMIDREVSDVDLCFHKNYYRLIENKIKLAIVRDNTISFKNSDNPYPDNNLIIVVDVDGTHIDIFFDNDFGSQKVVEIKGKCYLHGYEVLKKKLDLLMNDSKQVEKHKTDIVNSFLPDGKKKAVAKVKEKTIEEIAIENIPF